MSRNFYENFSQFLRKFYSVFEKISPSFSFWENFAQLRRIWPSTHDSTSVRFGLSTTSALWLQKHYKKNFPMFLSQKESRPAVINWHDLFDSCDFPAGCMLDSDYRSESELVRVGSCVGHHLLMLQIQRREFPMESKCPLCLH